MADAILINDINDLIIKAWRLGRSAALGDLATALNEDEDAGVAIDYQRVLIALNYASARTETTEPEPFI